MYNSTLTRKTPLKAKTALKAKTTLKAKTSLRAKTSLKAKTSFKSVQASKKPTNKTADGLMFSKTVYVKPPKKQRYYSVLTDDLKKCFITGEKDGYRKVHVHHIFGAANKANSEKYGFLVPLRADWHDMADYGVHFNRELDLKLKRLCETYWLLCYGSSEDFIKTFGQWW